MLATNSNLPLFRVSQEGRLRQSSCVLVMSSCGFTRMTVRFSMTIIPELTRFLTDRRRRFVLGTRQFTSSSINKPSEMLRIARRPALRALCAQPRRQQLQLTSSRVLSTSDAPKNIFFTTRA